MQSLLLLLFMQTLIQMPFLIYPLGPIIVIATLLFLLFGGSVEYILKDQWLNAFKNFLPLIILALIYFIHKIIHKTKFVKLETINLKPHDYDNQK